MIAKIPGLIAELEIKTKELERAFLEQNFKTFNNTKNQLLEISKLIGENL